MDEQTQEYDWHARNESIDSWVANLLDTMNSAMILNFDMSDINEGSAELDRQVEKSMASPRVVDGRACGRDLGQMLSIINEMDQIVDKNRQVVQVDKVNSIDDSSIGSSHLQKQLEERHFRMARVLDSFGRYEAGLLSGRIFFLGSHKQCSGTEMTLDKNNPTLKTAARHCLAKFTMDQHMHPSLKTRERYFFEQKNIIFAGICIPETCHTQSFHQHQHLFKQLVQSQFKLPRSLFIHETPELASIYCAPDNDSQFSAIPFSGKLFIVMLIVWLCGVIYATCFYKLQNDGTTKVTKNAWLNHIYSSLSLKRAWNDLIGDKANTHEPEVTRINLDTLNSIKVTCTLLAVLTHAHLLHMAEGADPARVIRSFDMDPLNYLIAFLTTTVDVFFVITGTILSYKAIKDYHLSSSPSKILDSNGKQAAREQQATSKNGRSFFAHCIRTISDRYTRLVPLFFIAFWFKKSILIHLGSGPMWDYGINQMSVQGACQKESWLSPLTFQSAFLSLTRQCFPQSWTISTDLVARIVVAPIILIMARQFKLGLLLSALVCFISVQLGSNFLKQLPLELTPQLHRFQNRAILYKSIETIGDSIPIISEPQYRMGPIVVGSVAGYFVYHYRESKQDWPLWFRGIATKLSLVMVFSTPMLCLLVPFFKSQFINEYTINTSAITYVFGLGRLSLSFAYAVLFIRMATDWRDNFWMKNSAGKFWQILSKLSYVVLLVHMDILVYSITSNTSITYSSKFRMFSLWASSYLISLFIAIPVYLLIENPIEKLIKGLLDGVDNKQQPVKLKQDDNNCGTLDVNNTARETQKNS